MMENLKNIEIYYFSGTGNARQIALWISEFANLKGINCNLFSIDKIDATSINIPSNNTLLIFISPVHGFNFPKITLDFIRHFPKGNNRIVLMNTRAGMKIGKFITPGLTGIAFMLSSLILIKKGYKIAGQIPFDMPSNWISIHPSLNDSSIKFIHRKNYERVEKHFNRIISGKSDFHSNRDIIQDLLISPIALGYYFVGRYAFAKSFYASAQCDNCGVCIEKCPVQAIENINGRPYWSFSCESCMRCMNNCPKNAIETSHNLLIIVYILSSFATTYFLSTAFSVYIESGIIRMIASSVLFLSFLWVFYKLQHLLLKSKLFGKLLAYTSLTYYKFWGRYKSIPDFKWKNN